MNQLLKAENLSHHFHASEDLFSNLSFDLSAGESLGIIGPNGSGKTTLLKIIAGLIKPSNGSVHIKAGKKISYIPQRTSFNEVLPLCAMDILKLHCEDEKKINETLELVEMSAKANHLFSRLSGGEKQRILIAQAVVNQPDLLILDEPNKGLDSAGQDQLLSILKQSLAHSNVGIIMVDHNINQTLNFCSKILCIGKHTHWHDKKELLDIDVLNSIYHCEFEHQLIHMDPKNWGKSHKHDQGHKK